MQYTFVLSLLELDETFVCVYLHNTIVNIHVFHKRIYISTRKFIAAKNILKSVYASA